MKNFLLLDALIDDLVPIRRVRPWTQVMLVWCGVSWSLVGLSILATGPLREGLISEFLTSPRFAFEISFGVLAGLASVATGLELGVPGTPAPPKSWSIPLVLFLAWVLAILSDRIHLAESVSFGPMRENCFLETLLVSIPPAIAALYLLRGRIAFHPARAGALVGAASAAIPALWMEFACLTEPLHALQFHLSPILIIGAMSAGVAAWTRLRI